MAVTTSTHTHPVPGFAQQVSTRIAFLITGLGMSAWAPLVPYAKSRLDINEATLGLLVLCLGVGSLLAMPVTGILTGRFGCRRVIVASGLLFTTCLAFLAIAPTVPLMALALLLFGAGLGVNDVAMNVQAVIVEKASGRNMMSGFHGFYSLGGILGAVGVTAMLWTGFSPLWSVMAVMGVIVVLLIACASSLLPYGSTTRDPLFIRPRGRILFIGSLCFMVFLAEGSVLDWSAVFMTSVRDIDPVKAGLGYAAFSVAMTFGRLTGDRIVKMLGGRRIILWGGLCAAAGFVLLVALPYELTGYLGFVLIGLGASNIVPVLFTAAGNQTVMPVSLAIASVATMGYAGILAGPAMVGLVAQFSSLSVSFLIVAAGLVAVASRARRVTSPETAQ